MNFEYLKNAIVTFANGKAYINIELEDKWMVIEAKLVPKQEKKQT